jgi:hypothetical protein
MVCSLDVLEDDAFVKWTESVHGSQKFSNRVASAAQRICFLYRIGDALKASLNKS